MKHQALKMIVTTLIIAVVISVTDRNIVPLLVMAAVSYVMWQVVRGFDA